MQLDTLLQMREVKFFLLFAAGVAAVVVCNWIYRKVKG